MRGLTMRFENVNELKAFIQWAKGQKIQQMSVGEVTVVFSPMAFMEEEPKIVAPEQAVLPIPDGALVGDDPDLYASS